MLKAIHEARRALGTDNPAGGAQDRLSAVALDQVLHWIEAGMFPAECLASMGAPAPLNRAPDWLDVMDAIIVRELHNRMGSGWRQILSIFRVTD